MATFPLTFPALTPQTASFRIVRATSSSVSPFTFRQQVYKFGGGRWEGNVDFPPLTQDQAAELQAMFLELEGQYGTFLYGDPNYLAQGARGLATGSPLVKGAGQTGNTLVVDGLSNNLTNWLKKGDYIQLGTGTSARLYQSSTDVNTNGSGEATITLYPALRTSPTDNAVVVVNGARGCFRLADNAAEWRVSEGNLYSVSFGFVEAIIE